MTTAFIATTGGHLTQLVNLAERIPPDPDSIWITHTNEQSTSLLATHSAPSDETTTPTTDIDALSAIFDPT